MHKVAVTGGAGFIGSNLVSRLVSEGYSVKVVDDFSTGLRSNLDDKSCAIYNQSIVDLYELKKAIDKGIIILNITQCSEGKVIQGMYETSSHLKKIGVLSGSDMTYESAVTKLMFLLGQKLNNSQLKKQLISNLRGELTL